jgi:copper(I)-binding protein
MMASVGLSMSAPDQGGHVIRSFTSGPIAHTPATSGDIAVYMTLNNKTGSADRLIGASSDAADKLHQITR